MSLRGILDDIVRNVDGSLAAMIMACDGVVIDEVSVERTEIDIPLLSAECAAVLGEIKSAVDSIKMGNLEEVSIATARINVAVRIFTDDYFAVLILKHDGNIGKGRYLLRHKSFEILRELS